MKKILTILLLTIGILNVNVHAQTGPDEDKLGAWYMYFFNKKFKNSQFGIQGDYQFRFWNVGNDLEQVLLRTGITYSPKNANILFTLGYGNITTGEYGNSTATVNEHRVYQEAIIPNKVGERFLFTHRFRYEQRWNDGQDTRTRYRYNLFLNVPLNGTTLEKGVAYIALYNEIFINGQRDIGDGRMVQFFDRNRTYLGMGYTLYNNTRMQAGWMRQTTNSWAKGQLQLSVHNSF